MLTRCRDGVSEEERCFRRQEHREQRSAPGKGMCLRVIEVESGETSY